MTGYAGPDNPGAGGQSVTTQYALDNGQTLLATAGKTRPSTYMVWDQLANTPMSGPIPYQMARTQPGNW